MRRQTTLVSGALLLALARAAQAQNGASLTRTLSEEVTRTSVWLLIGGLLFILAFKFADWTTPGNLKEQLAQGNTALAIYAGSLFIAAAIIIAALVG